MLCVVVNIKNSLNYDVVFPNGCTVAGAEKGERVCLARVNPSTFEPEDEEWYPSYKLRIDGLNVVENKYPGDAQYKLVKWNDANGGIFMCYPRYSDKYGRIKCDIRDPVTDLSVTKWLVTNYPVNFSTY